MDLPQRCFPAPETFLLLFAGMGAACATGAAPRPLAERVSAAVDGAPYLLVLGTAQDGGLPQIACRRDCCQRAREDPSLRRLVTSVMLVDPVGGRRWLFDASPHLPLQVDRASGHGEPGTGGRRPPLFDGVFLTHAHVGHYSGLLQFGREVYGSAPVDLVGTPRMMDFLEENGPWSLLFEAGHGRRVDLAPGETMDLGGGFSVTALAVPHRDEFSDTVGFVIDAEGFRVLYLPDIDKWSRWGRPVVDVIGSVDLALVDGTFYGPDELPGRAMSEVPHPFIVETMELMEGSSAAVRDKVYFTHLNHSNPAADPMSPEARAVRTAGFHIAEEGALLRLIH